jgi:hypothetical protein
MVPDLSITILDDGASRADLAARREVKYVFPRHDVANLRHVLLRSCRRIAYAGEVSTVRSVYFDDPHLSTCRANLDGIGIRHKTRLRWYDREQPTDRFFLEVKWRRHRLVGKRRLHLASSIPPAEVSFQTLHAGLRRHLPGEHLVRLAHDTEPVVLVEYRREHFVLRDGAARLTLDYDIRFYPQLGHHRLSGSFAESLPGVVLIECKIPMNGDVELHRVLAPLRARPSRFSKYVRGCRRLGYVAAT